MYVLASLGLRCSAGGFAWHARHLVVCKGSDVRPGVPWSPLLCRWLLRGRHSIWCSARGRRMYALASLALRWLFHGRRGIWCLCKRSDVRFGVPCLRYSAGGFCVAGAALGALQGVGCTPWRPGLRCFAGGFCGQARHLVPCRVGCTPWRPLVSALRGRRSTWCSVRGRMYALAYFGLRRSSGSFWHWLLCKGSDTPCASLGLRRFAGRFCVAGPALGALQGVGYALASLGLRWLLRGRRGNWCSARGRMYVWRPLVSAAFCVAGAALAALQGVGCTPWRPLVSAALPVAFAWQAQHLVRCKGTDVRPGVRWSPPLCSAQVMLFRSRARRCINSAHSD